MNVGCFFMWLFAMSLWFTLSCSLSDDASERRRETEDRIFFAREADDLSCDFNLTDWHRSLTGPLGFFRSAERTHNHTVSLFTAKRALLSCVSHPNEILNIKSNNGIPEHRHCYSSLFFHLVSSLSLCIPRLYVKGIHWSSERKFHRSRFLWLVKMSG